MKREMKMTKFESANFEYHGGYLHYNDGGERKFVARFKHRGPVTKAKFVKTLIKHYSVETYFARLGGAYNAQGEAPLQILMNDNILVFDKNEQGRPCFILDGKVI
jgi:hypothetical protein